MKRLICIIMMVMITFTGCNEKKDIIYDFSYYDILSFDEVDPLFEPIEDDIILLYGEDDIEIFFDKHFKARELGAVEPESDEVLLFIQFKAEGTQIPHFLLQDIYVSGKTLVVEATRDLSSFIGVSPAKNLEEVNGYFSYVYLLKIRRDMVQKDTKAVLKILE